MSDAERTITRYLLGELSEEERSALEEQYFAHPRVFEEVAAAETVLVDDYVRGALSADLQRRFERGYLADPIRRERVRFAEALAKRVDQALPPSVRVPLLPPSPALEPAPSWPEMPWPTRPRFGLAMATVVLVSTGVWVAIRSDRGREAPSPADGRRDEPEGSTPPADSPLTGGAAQVDPSPGPVDPTRLPQAFVTLSLAMGGTRGLPSPPSVLVIPPGTATVRVLLRLPEREHARYQIVARAIGGGEVLRRAQLRPAVEGSGAVLTVLVPASTFAAGDYMLTLQGVAGEGEVEDLGQLLFRVNR